MMRPLGLVATVSIVGGCAGTPAGEHQQQTAATQPSLTMPATTQPYDGRLEVDVSPSGQMYSQGFWVPTADVTSFVREVVRGRPVVLLPLNGPTFHDLTQARDELSAAGVHDVAIWAATGG